MYFKHAGTNSLHTERLFLRRFEWNDCEDMLKNWISDVEVQNNYGEPVYETRQAVQELLQKWIFSYDDDSFYRWAIILKDNNQNIGQIAFCRVYTDIRGAEVEYCISKAYWGNGYAAEALKAVMKYSFEQSGFDRIEAFHRIRNPSSGKVLQKAGMKRVMNITRYENSIDFFDDRLFYAMSKEKYNGTKR